MILLKGGYYLSSKWRFEKADILIDSEYIKGIKDNVEPEGDCTVLDIRSIGLLGVYRLCRKGWFYYKHRTQ